MAWIAFLLLFLYFGFKAILSDLADKFAVPHYVFISRVPLPVDF